MRNTPHLIVASSLALLSTCRADGLADLRGALGRLQGLAPIKATLEIKSWRHQGEGKDGDDKQGQASLMVEDSTRGLQLTYGRNCWPEPMRKKKPAPATRMPTRPPFTPCMNWAPRKRMAWYRPPAP